MIELANISSPTPRPTLPHTSHDIGCNYVSFEGRAMPIDYCMDVIYNDQDLGFKFVCSDTMDLVILEVYESSECDGTTPIMTHEINSSMIIYISQRQKYKYNNDELYDTHKHNIIRLFKWFLLQSKIS